MIKISLKDVGLTEYQKERVHRLLTAWGIYDRRGADYGAISQMTGQITQSPMYQFQKDNITEVADSANTRYVQPYSDTCLDYVREIIYHEMERRLIQVVVAKYRWTESKTVAEKVKILKIDPKTYHTRLDRAAVIINGKMIWGLAK